jgi:hypothetical protein
MLYLVALVHCALDVAPWSFRCYLMDLHLHMLLICARTKDNSSIILMSQFWGSSPLPSLLTPPQVKPNVKATSDRGGAGLKAVLARAFNVWGHVVLTKARGGPACPLWKAGRQA